MQILKLDPGQSFASNSYVISSLGEAVVIDPSFPKEAVQDMLGKEKKIVAVVLTHAHFDHMLQIDSYQGIPIYIGAADAVALSDPHRNCYMYFLGECRGYTGDYLLLSEGSEISFGEDKLSVIETPGHTKGSISLMAGNAVFVGDVVFAGGSYGRVDLPGGNIGELAKSIRRLLELPASSEIYSGHGDITTVGELHKYFS